MIPPPPPAFPPPSPPWGLDPVRAVPTTFPPWAPKISSAPRPIPADAPVMIATLSCRRPAPVVVAAGLSCTLLMPLSSSRDVWQERRYARRVGLANLARAGVCGKSHPAEVRGALGHERGHAL